MARPSNEEYLERVRKVVEQRGGTLLSTEYVNSRSKLNIQCDEGHLFSSRPHDISKKSWCPNCKREKHLRLMQANLRTVQELRKFAWIEHEGDCLATSPVSMHEKVSWKCKNPLHKPFPARLSNVLHQGNWCPACYAERRRLHPRGYLKRWLKAF